MTGRRGLTTLPPPKNAPSASQPATVPPAVLRCQGAATQSLICWSAVGRVVEGRAALASVSCSSPLQHPSLLPQFGRLLGLGDQKHPFTLGPTNRVVPVRFLFRYFVKEKTESESRNWRVHRQGTNRATQSSSLKGQAAVCPLKFVKWGWLAVCHRSTPRVGSRGHEKGGFPSRSRRKSRPSNGIDEYISVCGEAT